jgi:hypothetical protein
MTTAKINQRATFEAIGAALDVELRPFHYQEAHDRFVEGAHGQKYRNTTKRAEKLRQMFADSSPAGFVFCDGYIYRDYWFRSGQAELLPPFPVWTDEVLCATAFDAGYDAGRRHDHLFDHHGDSDSVYRRTRRRKAALAEFSVRAYFRSRWPDFYREPSNADNFTMPAKDDLSIVTPFFSLVIDVKSITEGYDSFTRRNPEPGIHYLACGWDENLRKTAMRGIAPGPGRKLFGLHDLPLNDIAPIQRLIVSLNMAQRGIEYVDVRRNIERAA